MTSLPYDIHDNPTYLAAQMADYAFTGVVKGDSVYCIVGSGSGLGKTYRASYIARRHGIKNVPEIRPPNEAALVKLFWTYRDCPVLLMDECDNLIWQEMTCNMLKQAFGPKRLLVLNSVEAMKNQRRHEEGSDKYDRSIPPPSFTLGENTRGIQLSNLDYRPEGARHIAAWPLRRPGGTRCGPDLDTR
jgi:hypothetical protein